MPLIVSGGAQKPEAAAAAAAKPNIQTPPPSPAQQASSSANESAGRAKPVRIVGEPEPGFPFKWVIGKEDVPDGYFSDDSEVSDESFDLLDDDM